MKGCLLFAFNNDTVDYLKLAVKSAKRIHEFLNLPVCVVTDENSSRDQALEIFDKTIILDNQQQGDSRFLNGRQIWKNRGRHLSYDLSPWSETLLLDVDYVINTTQLLDLFNTNRDFLCHRSIIDVTDRNHFVELDTLGQAKLPHAWATVCYFNKHSKPIFDIVKMIENNYQHYANVFKFPVKPFRNDYAFSIALHVVSGQSPEFVRYIPWNLPTANIDAEIINICPGEIILRYPKMFGESKKLVESKIVTDLHLMNKKNLETIDET